MNEITEFLMFRLMCVFHHALSTNKVVYVYYNTVLLIVLAVTDTDIIKHYTRKKNLLNNTSNTLQSSNEKSWFDGISRISQPPEFK